MPEITVVIPSYNHARYVRQAVQSVLDQQGVDLELVVVDDGSTDDSLQVLAEMHDPRLQVIPQANQGAHTAINRGLAAGSGEFCAILNSDDLYAPGRLEKALHLLRSNPEIGLVGSHVQLMDEAGQPTGVKHAYHDLWPWLLEAPERSFRSGDDLRAALLTENYWATTSNYVFPRAIYTRLGGFRPLRYAHDWDFTLRLACTHQLGLLPEPLVWYRVHSSNTIREPQGMAPMIFEICWILAVHLPHLRLEPWFTSEPPDKRTDQLLNSIYTYGMEKVLSVMLLSRLDENQDLSLRLLDAQDPERLQYLAYITSHLPPVDRRAIPARNSLIWKGLRWLKRKVFA